MADTSKPDSESGGVLKRLKPNRKAVVFVICLLLAMGAWFANALTGTFETSYSIPLSYRNQPFSTRLEGELPKNVVFHYQGTGWELLGLSMKKFPDSITVDLGGDKQSKSNKVVVRAVTLVSQLPQDPMPFKIEPEVIAPGLVNETSKKIPVKLVTDIKYRSRFGSVSGATIFPDSVLVSGPPQVLSKIDSVVTEPFSKVDVFSSVEVPLRIASKLPKGVLLSHETVQLGLVVSEFTEQSIIVPLETAGNVSGSLKLIPSKVKITFQYPMGMENMYDVSSFKAQVNAGQLTKDVPLEVVITSHPKEVQGIRVDPPRVEYLIETKE
ncbi:MAG: CdaR family protein [Bacteroidota bacterium]